MALVGGMPGFNLPAAAAAPKLIVEKPPDYTKPLKGLVGFAATDPWTEAQRAAGQRRELVAGGGIGRNRIMPPPLPVVTPRDRLAEQIVNGGNGGGYDRAASANYTTSGAYGGGGYGSSWGYTPSGVRSSARNPNGGWGTAASGNYGAGSDHGGGSNIGGGAGAHGGWSGGGMGGYADSPGSRGW